MFWDVPLEDREKLKNDWRLVKEYVKKYSFDNEEELHRLKANLMLIDYASPTQPRFRLRRSYVTTIVKSFLKQAKFEALPQPISKYSDFDAKCHSFADAFVGKSMKDRGRLLGVSIGRDKDSCQRIIVKMFGGNANSINKIKDFREIGLTAKTIILTSDGKKTEDTKLFQIDFDEFFDPDITFKEVIPEEDQLFTEVPTYSRMYSYFAEQSFVFIVFREPRKPVRLENGKYEKIPLSECVFGGFKRYSFKEHFIDNEVYRCWEDARRLVFTHTLKEERRGRGFAPNFPKGSDHVVFFRGGGNDSRDRKPRMQKWGIDIPMYLQSVWIKGDWIVKELNPVKWL